MSLTISVQVLPLNKLISRVVHFAVWIYICKNRSDSVSDADFLPPVNSLT